MRISEALEELNLIDKPLHNWFDDDDIDYMNQTLKTEKEQMRRVQKRNEEAVKKAQKAMGITDDVKNYGISSITKSKDQKETPVYESLNEDMFEDDYYDANDVMTRAEASKYWDENHNDDPILAEYKSKEEWMKDTEENIGFRDEDEPEEIDVEVTTFNPEDYDDEDEAREAFEYYILKKFGHTDGVMEESLEDDKAFCPVSGKSCKVFQNKPDAEMDYEVWYNDHAVFERYEINKFATPGKGFSTYTQDDYRKLKEAYEASLTEADEEEGDNMEDIWGKASFADTVDAEDDELEEACSCKGTLDKSRTKAEIGEGLTEDAEDEKFAKINAELVADMQEDEADAEPFR